MAFGRSFIALIAALLVTSGLVSAQPSTLANAAVTRHTASDTLSAQVTGLAAAATEATWIAWAVPSSNPDSSNCCWNTINGVPQCGCRLEESGGKSTGVQTGSAGPVALEAGRRLIVLVRVESHAIQKVVSYSDACALDAGGRPVAWMEGAAPAESVEFLSHLAGSIAPDGKLSQPASGALAALALHEDQSAVRSLIFLAESAQASRVRSQALFWLGQRAGLKATTTIVGAIQNDPDTAVKKQAVFALSQLPKDEGVPKLIDVARTNRNGEVRKQAIFWLGQSKDPRALAFFREVLLK